MEKAEGRDFRHQIEQMLGVFPAVILVLDKDLRLVYGNRQNNQIADGPLKDLIGLESGDTDTFVLGGDSQLRQVVEQTILNGAGQSSVERLQEKRLTGSKKILVTTGYIPDGPYVLIMLQDITELPLNTEVCDGKQWIEQLLDEAGRICHKMNQPLQVATGSLDLALLMFEGNGKNRELITEARDQMSRVAVIAREIMGLRNEYLDDDRSYRGQ